MNQKLFAVFSNKGQKNGPEKVCVCLYLKGQCHVKSMQTQTVGRGDRLQVPMMCRIRILYLYDVPSICYVRTVYTIQSTSGNLTGVLM